MDSVSDDYHRFSVGCLSHLKCKMEVLHYQFSPAIGNPLTVILCLFETLSNGKYLQTSKHAVHLFHHGLLAQERMICHRRLIKTFDLTPNYWTDDDSHASG